MKPENIIKPLCALLIIIAINMIAPALIALYYHEFSSLRAFCYVIVFIIISCSTVLLLTHKTKESQLQTREGFLFVTLSWITASLIGALPLYLSGSIPNLSSAFFETISGFTTTGATILTDIESLPRSILFWRSQTHWLGGMGIVVLTVAVLPMLGIGGLQLIKAEAPGPKMDKLAPRVTGTAKILWIIYLGLTAIETILLIFGGLNLFDALTTTFGTLATGGFSSYNSSIGYFNSAFVHVIVTIFMVLAGLNFTLHYRLITGDIRQILRDSEYKLFIAIFSITSVLIAVNLFCNEIYSSFPDSLRHAAFQTASILTTTGFASTDYSNWPSISLALLFLLMFIGGCSGSTGGGIKVIRVLTIFKMALNEMKYLLHPRGIFRLRVNNSSIGKDIAYSIAGFIFLYIVILLITTLIVSTCGADLLTSFSTALATVGNIGPGFGMVGPANNYAFYPDYIKWFLSFAMLVGRLELYTVLIIFTPLFWKK